MPEDAMGFSIWVQPAGVKPEANLWARMRDSRGLFFDTLVGNLGPPGWNRIQSDLSPVVAAGRRFDTNVREVDMVPPFSLQSFQITDSLHTLGSSGLGSVFLGRLDALTPNGPVILSDFATSEDWSAIEDFSRPGLYALESSRSAAGERFPDATRYSCATVAVSMRA